MAELMITQNEDVKTTLRLPRELWIAAKHLAIEENITLQDLIAAALAAYLKEKKARSPE